MSLSRFFLYHVVFACMAMGAVFWPSVRIMAYFSGCLFRCEGVTALGIMIGVACGAIAGYFIYAVAFRLFLGQWPQMMMLAYGAVLAVVGVFVICIAAASTGLGGLSAIALSVGLILYPGSAWVEYYCIFKTAPVSGSSSV